MIGPCLSLEILGKHTPSKLYLLERIKDGGGYRKGEQIWAHAPCNGWKTIDKKWG